MKNLFLQVIKKNLLFFFHLKNTKIIFFFLFLDAFSAFGTDNAKEHNKEASVATKFLVRELIPNFAHSLNRRFANASLELLSNNLTEEIHSVGIK